jgi:biopolymer transport protein ExbD
VRISLAYGPPVAVYIGKAKTPVSIVSLKAEMQDIAASKADVRVLIHADQRLPHREIKSVLGTLQESGFRTASLIAERLPQPRP